MTQQTDRSAAAEPVAPPPSWQGRAALPAFSPRTLLSRALSVPLVLGFSVFLPLLVLVQPGTGLHDAALWLQLALAMYSGIRLSAMILTSRRKLLAGSFWLFVYMAMGVAPLAQAVLGRTPTPVVGARTDLTEAVALVLIGCVAFDIGSLLARQRPERKRDEGCARRWCTDAACTC